MSEVNKSILFTLKDFFVLYPNVVLFIIYNYNHFFPYKVILKSTLLNFTLNLALYKKESNFFFRIVPDA